jgi:Asp-tRNA(Asn)/Glu-tRNA(Gln) amidotransferase C subunit
MLKMPYLYEISQGTYAAQFDMCKVGELKDPQNQKLIKKGMQINTTSQQFYFHFHGRKCNQQHEHQTLEGSTIHKGERIQRTTFSENYTRKFARSIAQVLTKVKNMKELPVLCWDETAYALQGIKRSVKADTNLRVKRAKLQNSSLIEPQEMPAKRRRIHENHRTPCPTRSYVKAYAVRFLL